MKFTLEEYGILHLALENQVNRLKKQLADTDKHSVIYKYLKETYDTQKALLNKMDNQEF